MRRAVVARTASATNRALADRKHRWTVLSPEAALRELQPGDVALGRLDVLPTLDGVEDGLWALGALEARGIRVLNAPSALLACHDKLLTARILRRAGLPHPRTRLVTTTGIDAARSDVEVVVKPRFGSMGQAVTRCDGARELALQLKALERADWFRKQGALVQDLITPLGYDLRVLVAGRRVIGGVTRVCREGEWRTNVALGAQRVPTSIPAGAQVLALRAARALDVCFVGVDLLPTEDGWAILELNGAVEFTSLYNVSHDVFALARAELARYAEQRDASVGQEELVTDAAPSA
jgi:RimK family alpha-L-glutamate ligase